MSRVIRALNRSGIEQFRAYLERLRSGKSGEPPFELLDDARYTGELAVEVDIDTQVFATRFAVGRFLGDRLAAFGRDELDGNAGLWAWLSLFLFDQVCPVGRDGMRRPGQDYRHIPDFGYRYRYRHLLYGPYQVYRRHGGFSMLLLSGNANTESTIYHEIVSRQDLIANRGVIEACSALYLDRHRGAPKQGCQDAKGPPGSVRRFVRVLQQLELNYDIYGMSGRDIVSLLPAEFDGWANRGQAKLELQ